MNRHITQPDFKMGYNGLYQMNLGTGLLVVFPPNLLLLTPPGFPPVTQLLGVQRTHLNTRENQHVLINLPTAKCKKIRLFRLSLSVTTATLARRQPPFGAFNLIWRINLAEQNSDSGRYMLKAESQLADSQPIAEIDHDEEHE